MTLGILAEVSAARAVHFVRVRLAGVEPNEVVQGAEGLRVPRTADVDGGNRNRQSFTASKLAKQNVRSASMPPILSLAKAAFRQRPEVGRCLRRIIRRPSSAQSADQ